MKEILRPILTKAEEYTEIPEPLKGFPRQDNRPGYEMARDRLINEINDIENKINCLDSKYVMSNVILNLQMRIDRSAKSDHPTSFLKGMGIKQVGTKKWVQQEKNKKGDVTKKIGKDIFIMTNKSNLTNIKSLLNTNSLQEKDKDTIRSFEKLYIDDHNNALKLFSSEWDCGRVEVILHPYYDEEEQMFEKFKKLLVENGVNLETMRTKQYEKGPRFISVLVNKEALNAIKQFNPLRSVHPLKFRSVNSDTLTDEGRRIPELADNEFIPEVTVGIFDGGITTNHKILSKYVVEHDLSSEPKNDEEVVHGDAVAGMILFGNLKDHLGHNLPTPSVKVESYRVLPLKDKNDIDLYEIIDYIEKVAIERPDIKVFNLSLGPEGPIEDDLISRFTYSIDRLSKDGKRIFVVAVGNDGEYDDELGRIQAPSDTVNNIAVGGYAVKENSIIRAPYSCFGDGREGAKVKPDVVEYSGTEEEKLYFVGPNDYIYYGCGTSFASPVVSRKLAEIIGYSSIASPRTAKALMIQTSEHPCGRPDKFLGYGAAREDYLDILECTENKITVLYENYLFKAKRAKLRIPFVEGLNFNGKVEFSWTICVSTDVDPSDADDYTNMSIEDTFYPNSYKYKYKYPLNNKTKTINIKKDPQIAKDYDKLGWEKPQMPISKSNTDKKYLTEQERREDFKWDTVMKKSSGFMQYKQIQEPYIIIHALSRDKENDKEDRLYYSVALTIEYKDCKESVYKETIKQFHLLEQAEVVNINEIMIENK